MVAGPRGRLQRMGRNQVRARSRNRAVRPVLRGRDPSPHRRSRFRCRCSPGQLHCPAENQWARASRISSSIIRFVFEVVEPDDIALMPQPGKETPEPEPGPPAHTRRMPTRLQSASSTAAFRKGISSLSLPSIRRHPTVFCPESDAVGRGGFTCLRAGTAPASRARSSMAKATGQTARPSFRSGFRMRGCWIRTTACRWRCFLPKSSARPWNDFTKAPARRGYSTTPSMAVPIAARVICRRGRPRLTRSAPPTMCS